MKKIVFACVPMEVVRKIRDQIQERVLDLLRSEGVPDRSFH